MKFPVPILPMNSDWSKVTALFGGTFDPPHLGHLEAVEGLFDNPGVKRVIVIPSRIPPLKSTVTSADDRFHMTEELFSDSRYFDRIEVSRIELDRNPEKPSYTYDTLEELKARNPHLAWVLGLDQWTELPKWHRFPEILNEADWIVLERRRSSRSGIPASFPRPKTRVIFTPTPARALSSTEIRENIAKTGEIPEQSVGPNVLRYIHEKRLYL